MTRLHQYKRVLVALSGGIDSAITLHLLSSTHPHVHFEAVHMTTWHDDYTLQHCPNNDKLTLDPALASIHKTLQLIKKQRGASIALRQVDFSKDYWLDVFHPSLHAFAHHQTPNPDILCNKYIKLGALLEYGRREGFDAIATGHYLSIQEDGQIYQAKDGRKDQTYFMAGCQREQFKHVECPLGRVLKGEVRRMARGLGWEHLLKRKESMGLCMVEPSTDFSTFLSEYIPAETCTLIDERGCMIGRTNKFMTIGQAVSMGGLKERLYVAERRRVSTTSMSLLCLPREHPRLWSKRLLVNNFNWISHPSNQANNLRCSIRSMDKEGTSCRIHSRANIVEIELDAPVWAATPGQWAVLYEKDGDEDGQGMKCLGGGIIISSVDEHPS